MEIVKVRQDDAANGQFNRDVLNGAEMGIGRIRPIYLVAG